MASGLVDVIEERQRQKGIWDESFDSANTPNDWATFAAHYVAAGVYDGRKHEYTVEKNRECFVKAAAILIAAIEQIDGFGMTARHYDR